MHEDDLQAIRRSAGLSSCITIGLRLESPRFQLRLGRRALGHPSTLALLPDHLLLQLRCRLDFHHPVGSLLLLCFLLEQQSSQIVPT